MTDLEKRQIFNTVVNIAIGIIFLMVATIIFNAGYPWIAISIIAAPLVILFYKKFG